MRQSQTADRVTATVIIIVLARGRGNAVGVKQREAPGGGQPQTHRRFLVSFERGEPEWELLGLAGISELPAVQWRLRNLDTLTAERRAARVAELEALLYGDAR